MSLTQEDLKAISDLIDIKLDKQEQNINKRFDEVDKRFDEQEKRINDRFEQIDKRFDEQEKIFNDRFDEQEKRFDKKLDDFRTEFKEMLIDNNMLIAEHVQRVVSESEERLTREIQEIKNVAAQNSYDIAGIKRKIS